ncbi:MAG: methyltransferase domain-containing protein [Alphaproteobacteria bacterium]|nr:methyltransferase domain-containing protein [Alphaproteobacteria bacterium]
MKSGFRLTFSALALVLATACATTPSAPPALKAADYAAILSDPARSEADKKDDAARKPAEVLDFVQVRPGDVVLEMEVGRGWFTDILSAAVGPTGRIITQNPKEFAYSGPAMAARKATGRLANVTETTTPFDRLEAADGSVDKVLWMLGPHELYYTPKDSPGLGDPARSYAEIARVLKPGGVFIAMDHAAAAGAPTTTGGTIHRIDPAVVLASAASAGLVLEAKSDILANPEDDRSKMVFDATIRRHTDQFLFRFRKPK